METATKRMYEAMFLVDSAQAAGDWDGTIGAVETILKRADAEVVTLKKWSERRLAYDVGKSSRGTYLLSYFKADTQAVTGLEKDLQLSESVMRVLVLAADERPEGFNDRDIAALDESTQKARREDEATPAPPAASEAPAEAAPASEATAVAAEPEGTKEEPQPEA